MVEAGSKGRNNRRVLHGDVTQQNTMIGQCILEEIFCVYTVFYKNMSNCTGKKTNTVLKYVQIWLVWVSVYSRLR